METGKFQPRKQIKKTHRLAVRRMPKNVSSSNQSSSGNAMLFSMCIGALACAMALAISLNGDTVDKAIKSVKKVVEEQTDLGKLQFVESTIAAVFQPENGFTMPIDDAISVFETEDGGFKLKGKPQGDVFSAADGVVEEAGEDYVVVSMGDAQARYGELSFVCAEKGQKLKKGDALGRLNSDGALILSISVKGKAIHPAELGWSWDVKR